MTAASLEISAVRKTFGRRIALDNLSFSVPGGKAAAFVGANGAGKTTTFALIGGFITPDSGRILIDGMPLKNFRADGGVIGLLPQDANFYEDRTVGRQLFMFARLAGLSHHQSWIEVERVLDLVALSDRIHATPESLSRGMRVRFGIAQALVGSPPLILLDEPMAGLDPIMIDDFRNLVRSLHGHTTLVISSHQLNELQALTDYVVMIDNGALVRQGALEQIRSEGGRILCRVGALPQSIEPLQRRVAALKLSTEPPQTILAEFDPGKISRTEATQQLLSALLAEGLALLSLETEQSLEETFRKSRKDPG